MRNAVTASRPYGTPIIYVKSITPKNHILRGTLLACIISVFTASQRYGTRVVYIKGVPTENHMSRRPIPVFTPKRILAGVILISTPRAVLACVVQPSELRVVLAKGMAEDSPLTRPGHSEGFPVGGVLRSTYYRRGMWPCDDHHFSKPSQGRVL